MPAIALTGPGIIGFLCDRGYFIDMKSRSVQACDCACYLAKNIRRAEGALPSAQRIHNLLYLATRESTCIFGEGLVPCTFRCTDDGVICENCSWKGGHTGRWRPTAAKLTKNVIGVLNSILAIYGSWNESELREYVVSEKSWIEAKQNSTEQAVAALSEETIAEDAQKLSRLKALWSMSHCTYDPGYYEETDMSGCLCFSMK